MKTKKIMALILSLCIVCSMFTGTLAAEKDFSDVEENSWYYGDVQFVYEKGLMNGIDDDVFSPETPTTRGMVVTVLYRVEGSPSVLADAEFKDVNGDEYFADAVNWASENNIVNGYDDGNFGPEDLITREQAATIYFRYAQYKGEDVSADADLSAFEDADLISEYAVPAMKWALGTGLFKGVTNTSVAPDGNLTRAQLAATLRRTVEVEADQPIEEPEPEVKEFTVKFNLNYDEAETLESVKVKEGEKVSAPKNPARDNFIFNGWYTDAELTEKYDFNSKVTADIELFAKWNKRLVNSGSGMYEHVHDYTFTYIGGDQHFGDCPGCLEDITEACTYTDGALVCDVCKTRALNPSNAAELIDDAEEGTIILTEGDYGNIGFYNGNATRKGLTIIGEGTVTVESIELKDCAVFEDITFKNIKFDGAGVAYAGIKLHGNVKDLKVIDCEFVNEASIVTMTGTTVNGATVEGCTFDHTGADTEIHYGTICLSSTTEGTVKIKNNTIINSQYNAVQLNGTMNADVEISGNTITGAADRAFRFGNIGAEKTVLIKNNTITASGDNGCNYKATSVDGTATVTFENNTVDGILWNGYDFVADTTNAQTVFDNAPENVTIVLKDGEYDRLYLNRGEATGNEIPQEEVGCTIDGHDGLLLEYVRNIDELTIKGSGDNAKIDGFTLRSGFGYTGGPADYDAYYLSKVNIGTLKFSNVTFTDRVYISLVSSLNNEFATIENLVFENVTFDVSSANASLYVSTKFGKIANIKLEGCKFKNASNTNQNGATIACAQGVVNVTVDGCEFENINYDAVQLAQGTFTGEIKFTNNILTTVGKRALRIASIGAGAEVTITGNETTDVSTNGEICKSGAVDVTAEVTVSGNKWDAQADATPVLGLVATPENILDASPLN